jgi:hypothetical protein
MLITSGNQLASIAEIFVGKMPGQNTPATTTQETVQQGMAVFTAIYKRVYRSLAQEFRKIYNLNRIMPDLVAQDSKDSGIPIAKTDYQLPMWVIIPGADPTGDSGTVKQSKLQQVGQLLSLGTVDPMVYTRRVLDANEIPNAQELIKQPAPPPPDPKAQQIQMEMQQGQQEHQQKMEAGQQDVQNKQTVAQIEAAKAANKLTHEQQMQALAQQGAQMDIKHNAILSTIEQHQKVSNDLLEAMATHAKTMQGLHANVANTSQELRHNEVKHRQQLTLAAQKARQDKAKASSTK